MAKRYRVTLTATDEDGATGSTVRDVTVNVPPRAAFDFACSGLVCSFADVSVDPGGEIVSRSWAFSDPAAASTVQNPGHTFGRAGTFPVTLTVVDNGGLSASAANASPNGTRTICRSSPK